MVGRMDISRCCCPVCRIAEDKFNRADNTDLGPTWEETAGDWEIDTNKLAVYSADAQLTYDSDHPSAQTSHYVMVKVRGDTEGDKARVIVAYDPNNGDYLAVEIEFGPDDMGTGGYACGTLSLIENGIVLHSIPARGVPINNWITLIGCYQNLKANYRDGGVLWGSYGGVVYGHTITSEADNDGLRVGLGTGDTVTGAVEFDNFSWHNVQFPDDAYDDADTFDEQCPVCKTCLIWGIGDDTYGDELNESNCAQTITGDPFTGPLGAGGIWSIESLIEASAADEERNLGVLIKVSNPMGGTITITMGNCVAVFEDIGTATRVTLSGPGVGPTTEDLDPLTGEKYYGLAYYGEINKLCASVWTSTYPTGNRSIILTPTGAVGRTCLIEATDGSIEYAIFTRCPYCNSDVGCDYCQDPDNIPQYAAVTIYGVRENPDNSYCNNNCYRYNGTWITYFSASNVNYCEWTNAANPPWYGTGNCLGNTFGLTLRIGAVDLITSPHSGLQVRVTVDGGYTHPISGFFVPFTDYIYFGRATTLPMDCNDPTVLSLTYIGSSLTDAGPYAAGYDPRFCLWDEARMSVSFLAP